MATGTPVPLRTRAGTILVVDDETHTVGSLRLLLGDDFQVREATNLLEAERILDREDVDVVLTDFEMPKGSGILLLSRLRRQHPRIVGLLMTAHADAPEVSALKADGHFHVLPKPLDPEALVRTLQQAMHLSRIRKSISRLPRPR